MHLAGINVAIIGVGWGVFTWLVPPYAKDEIGVSAQLSGLLLLANAVTVAVAQVPLFLALGFAGILLSQNPHSWWGGLTLGALFGPWLVWSYFRRRILAGATSHA